MSDPFLTELDRLKAEHRFNDAELAAAIGLADRQHLAKIRSGERSIPLEVKIRVWDLLGYPWTREAMMSLLPERFLERIRKRDTDELQAAGQSSPPPAASVPPTPSPIGGTKARSAKGGIVEPLETWWPRKKQEIDELAKSKDDQTDKGKHVDPKD